MPGPGNAQYADGGVLSFVANYLMTGVDDVGVWGRGPDGVNKRPNAIHVGTGGVTFSDGSTQTVAASAGADPSGMKLSDGGSGPGGGVNVASMGAIAVVGSLNVAVNTAYCHPFILNEGQIVTELGVNIFGVNAGAECRVAIYANNSDLDPYPAALQTSVDFSATPGGNNMNALGAAWTVPASGLYWAVINTDAVAGYSLRGASVNLNPSVLGMTGNLVPYTMLIGGMVYAGGPPDPFAITGQSLVTTTAPSPLFTLQ